MFLQASRQPADYISVDLKEGLSIDVLCKFMLMYFLQNALPLDV